jgi:hypothetical protein
MIAKPTIDPAAPLWEQSSGIGEIQACRHEILRQEANQTLLSHFQAGRHDDDPLVRRAGELHDRVRNVVSAEDFLRLQQEIRDNEAGLLW